LEPEPVLERIPAYRLGLGSVFRVEGWLHRVAKDRDRKMADPFGNHQPSLATAYTFVL